MSDNFYRAFEDKHRGSRELIKSRLEIYLPFIEKIKEIQPKPKTIDLGCGRGEWLELYKNHQHPKSDAMPWLTWEESAKMLMEKILDVK